MKRTKPQTNTGSSRSNLRKRKLDKPKVVEKTPHQSVPTEEVEPHKKFAIYAKKALKIWNPPLKKRNCTVEMRISTDHGRKNQQLSTFDEKADLKKQWKPPQPIKNGKENTIMESNEDPRLSEETKFGTSGGEFKPKQVLGCADNVISTDKLSKDEGPNADSDRFICVEKAVKVAHIVIESKKIQKSSITGLSADQESIDRFIPLGETNECFQANELGLNLTLVSNTMCKGGGMESLLTQDPKEETNNSYKVIPNSKYQANKFLIGQCDKQETEKNQIDNSIDTCEGESSNPLSHEKSIQKLNSNNLNLNCSNVSTKTGRDLIGRDDLQEIEKSPIPNSSKSSRNETSDHVSYEDFNLQLNSSHPSLADSIFPTNTALISGEEKQYDKTTLIQDINNTGKDEALQGFSDGESNLEFSRNSQNLSEVIPQTNTAQCSQEYCQTTDCEINPTKINMGLFEAPVIEDERDKADSCFNSAQKNDEELNEKEPESINEEDKTKEQSSDEDLDLDEIISKTIEKHLKEGEMRLKNKLLGIDQSSGEDESSQETVILSPKNYQQNKMDSQCILHSFREGGTNLDDTVILTPKNSQKLDSYSEKRRAFGEGNANSDSKNDNWKFCDAKKTSFSNKLADIKIPTEGNEDLINSSFLTVDEPFDLKGAEAFRKSEKPTNFNLKEVNSPKAGDRSVIVDNISRSSNAVIGFKDRQQEAGQKDFFLEDYISAFKTTDETDFLFSLDENNYSTSKPPSSSNSSQNKTLGYSNKGNEESLDFSDKNPKQRKNCSPDYVNAICSSSQVNGTKGNGKSLVQDFKTKMHSFSDLCKIGYFDRQSSKFSPKSEAIFSRFNNDAENDMSASVADSKLQSFDQQPMKINEKVTSTEFNLTSESLIGINTFYGQPEKATSMVKTYRGEEEVTDDRDARKSLAPLHFNDQDQQKNQEKMLNELVFWDWYLDKRTKEKEEAIENVGDLILQTRNLVNDLVKKIT